MADSFYKLDKSGDQLERRTNPYRTIGEPKTPPEVGDFFIKLSCDFSSYTGAQSPRTLIQWDYEHQEVYPALAIDSTSKIYLHSGQSNQMVWDGANYSASFVLDDLEWWNNGEGNRFVLLKKEGEMYVINDTAGFTIYALGGPGDYDDVNQRDTINSVHYTDGLGTNQELKDERQVSLQNFYNMNYALSQAMPLVEMGLANTQGGIEDGNYTLKAAKEGSVSTSVYDNAIIGSQILTVENSTGFTNGAIITITPYASQLTLINVIALVNHDDNVLNLKYPLPIAIAKESIVEQSGLPRLSLQNLTEMSDYVFFVDYAADNISQYTLHITEGQKLLLLSNKTICKWINGAWVSQGTVPNNSLVVARETTNRPIGWSTDYIHSMPLQYEIDDEGYLRILPYLVGVDYTNGNFRAIFAGDTRDVLTVMTEDSEIINGRLSDADGNTWYEWTETPYDWHIFVQAGGTTGFAQKVYMQFWAPPNSGGSGGVTKFLHDFVFRGKLSSTSENSAVKVTFVSGKETPITDYGTFIQALVANQLYPCYGTWGAKEVYKIKSDGSGAITVTNSSDSQTQTVAPNYLSDYLDIVTPILTP
jgi:hypothetical protein